MTTISRTDGDDVIDLTRDTNGDQAERWAGDRATLRSTRTATATEKALLDAADNEASVRDKAATALADNKTFLAVTSPTNAQVVAQVKALTRQNNALIRLALSRFDAAD